jgi:potassium efflux system protein
MPKLNFYIALAIALAFSLTYFKATGQNKKKHDRVTVSDSLRASILYRDSLLRTLKRSDTSLNNLLQKVENYTVVLNQISNSQTRGLDTTEISEGLPLSERVVNRMRSSVSDDKFSTLRFLYNLRNILTRRQDQMDIWQEDLNEISSNLVQTRNRLQGIANDNTLNNAPADSSLQITFIQQRELIHQKWLRLDSINKKNLVKVGNMQNRLATVYIALLDAQDQIKFKIRSFNTKALSCEYGYIWSTNARRNGISFNQASQNTFDINKLLVTYYINGNVLIHLCGAFLLIIFFTWLYRNRKRVLRRQENPQETLQQTNYTARHPFISSLLVAVIIVPYFYDHPPAAFLEMFFLLMIAAIILLVRTIWPRQLLNFLYGLLIISFVYSISNLYTQVCFADRFMMLFFAVAGAAIGYRMLISVRKTIDLYPPYSILILKIFTALQIVSVIGNVFGRFTIAKIIAVTAVYNLWLAFGFYLFVQIMMESLYLQLEGNKSNSVISSYLDFKIVQKKFKNILGISSFILWAIMLTQNLSVEDAVFEFLADFLTKSHQIGSTGTLFTFGSILIFAAVIWLASVVARIITYLYDFASQHNSDTAGIKRKRRTSMLLIRISIFSIGFMLAVAASGFPLDKLTIIISALGVGIGFGLQNIVNNLVSGLILAFEKPVQIGDIIEVANRSGTIQEIGIRSSKILTSDGAEVIVPNGDLISQHVINWTLSNNNRRVELIIGVAYGSDIEQVKTLLKGILQNREDIMTSPEPLVFLHNLSESSVDFRVLFWAADITTWLELKSRILTEIYNTLNAAGVEIPYPQRDVNIISIPKSVTQHLTQRGDNPAL